MIDDNRGRQGDSEGHAIAGSQSSGNQGNPQQHADAGRKGGQANQSQDTETEMETESE